MQNSPTQSSLCQERQARVDHGELVVRAVAGSTTKRLNERQSALKETLES